MQNVKRLLSILSIMAIILTQAIPSMLITADAETHNINLYIFVHDDNGDPVSGVVFDAYADANFSGGVLGTSEASGSDGFAHFTSYDDGGAQVTELFFKPRDNTFPAGYQHWSVSNMDQLREIVPNYLNDAVATGSLDLTNSWGLGYVSKTDGTRGHPLNYNDGIVGMKASDGASGFHTDMLAFTLSSELAQIKIVKKTNSYMTEGQDVPLAGAKFNIRYGSYNSTSMPKITVNGQEYNYGDIIMTLETDANGVAKTGFVLPRIGDYDQYLVYEIEAPEGYAVASTGSSSSYLRYVYGFDIKNGQTTEFEIYDNELFGRLSFQKNIDRGVTDREFEYTIELKNEDGTPFNGDVPYVATEGLGGLPLGEQVPAYHADESELDGIVYVLYEADENDMKRDDQYQKQYYGTGNVYIFRTTEDLLGDNKYLYGKFTDDNRFGMIVKLSDLDFSINGFRFYSNSEYYTQDVVRYYAPAPKQGTSNQADVSKIIILDPVRPTSLQNWNIPEGSVIDKLDTSEVTNMENAFAGSAESSSKMDLSKVNDMKYVVSAYLGAGIKDKTLDMSDFDASGKSAGNYTNKAPWITFLKYNYILMNGNKELKDGQYPGYNEAFDYETSKYNKVIINDTFINAPAESRGANTNSAREVIRYWVNQDTGRLMNESVTPGGTYVPEDLSENMLHFENGKATVKLKNTGYFALQKVPLGAQYTITETKTAMWDTDSTMTKGSYRENTNKVTGTISGGGSGSTNRAASGYFMNRAHSKSVTFKKVDDKGNPLEGAFLAVKDYAGNEIDSWTSDGTDEGHTLDLIPSSYTFEEITPPDGYETAEPIAFEIDNDGKMYVDGEEITDEVLTITMQDKAIVDINVAKKWVDADDKDGIRPESISVKLLADGEETDAELTLNADNKWTGTFVGMDKFNDGKEIAYTVEEVEVPEGYEVSYEQADMSAASPKAIITNTHTPAEEPKNDSEDKEDEEEDTSIRDEDDTSVPEDYIEDKTTKNTDSKVKSRGTDTGDNTSMTALISLFVVCATAMIALIFTRRKQR